MGLIVTKFQRHGKQPSPCESQLLLGLCACRRTDDRRRHYTSWLGCQILPHTNHFHPFNCQLSSEFYTPIYRSCIRVNQAPSMHRITRPHHSWPRIYPREKQLRHMTRFHCADVHINRHFSLFSLDLCHTCGWMVICDESPRQVKASCRPSRNVPQRERTHHSININNNRQPMVYQASP